MANGQQQTKRDRQRARAEAKRAAERKAQQRRSLAYTLGGIALVALVVVFVVAFMGGGDDDGVGPSQQGDVTVQGAPRDAPLQAGEQVPAFTAPDVFGGSVDWADYAGSPAVIPVWAPWCPHCQTELPVIDQVMEDYPDVGLVTIVTAIDAQPGPAPDQYMTDEGLSFAAAVDDGEGTLASAFGIQVFPTLYFVNSDGTVAVQLDGEVDEATLRSTIESLI
jgi:thiol-disulfide isomerase/thioredoxin